ncbi:ninjurin-1-like [Culicoides brevitarsis]|uniref:ninjurin-1-like n=1 Tax=Culicoides brevitarsis TaxID=469753 RepID=UPI00307B2EB6
MGRKSNQLLVFINQRDDFQSFLGKFSSHKVWISLIFFSFQAESQSHPIIRSNHITMMSLMAACDKTEDSERLKDVESQIVMKKITFSNSSPVDEVDATINRVSIDRQPSLEKLQFNAKRAIVAGMLDITLLTSNANQLKYITAHDFNATNISIIFLISLSLFLQVCSGLMMIYKHSVVYADGSKPASKCIEVTLIAFVFLITVINVVASVFAPNVADSPLRRF